MEYCHELAVVADCCLEYSRTSFIVFPTKKPPLDLNKTEGLLPFTEKENCTAKITQLGIRKIKKSTQVD